MKLSLVILFISLHFFAQKKVALVKTINNQSAYYELEEKKITYFESSEAIINEHICPYKDGMARIRRNSKFYFINNFGKPVFESEYEKAEDFNEELAEVKIDDKWGFINKKGELVIKPQFYETKIFSCGLASVAMSPRGKHGYIDKTGKFVIEPQFDLATTFNDNQAWVYLNGKWGLINKTGNYLIQPKYLEFKASNEGFTWVKKDGLWGMIDSLDNYIIQPNERNALIYCKNASFKLFNEFHDGLIIFQSKKMFGYMDKKLKVKIKADYDKAFDFSNGLALVVIEKDWGIIDSTGKIIIPLLYKELKLSNNQIFPAKNQEGLWGYLNIKNEWIIAPQFKNAYLFEETNN